VQVDHGCMDLILVWLIMDIDMICMFQMLVEVI